MSVDYAWTYLKQTQLLSAWFVPSVSSCPCLSWSAVAMRMLTWAVFVPRASRRCCALAVALHWCDSGLGLLHAWNYPTTFSLHEIFKCSYLKFTAYGRKQTYIHNFCKCRHTSVGLAQARPNYCDLHCGLECCLMAVREHCVRPLFSAAYGSIIVWHEDYHICSAIGLPIQSVGWQLDLGQLTFWKDRTYNWACKLVELTIYLLLSPLKSINLRTWW